MWCRYVVLAAWVACAIAYPTGPPVEVCQTMMPGHPVPPQSSPPPYTITTSAKKVKAGTPIEVVINGIGPENTMKGLMLQARNGDKIIGKFVLPPNDSFAQLMNCGQQGDTVSHKKHDEKDDKRIVAYTWTAPADFRGEIKFRATIALNGAVFWVGVESESVQVTK